MATLVGSEILLPSMKVFVGGTKGRFVVWPGSIAFTGPGATTLEVILASPEHEPQLTVNDALTTENKLVLNSYKAGRAVIRIEPSQFTLKKGVST